MYKNNTFKPSYETNPYDQLIKKGFDLVLDNYLFQRIRLNEPNISSHSLNWRCIQNKIFTGSVTIVLNNDDIYHFVDHQKKR